MEYIFPYPQNDEMIELIKHIRDNYDKEKNKVETVYTEFKRGGMNQSITQPGNIQTIATILAYMDYFNQNQK